MISGIGIDIGYNLSQRLGLEFIQLRGGNPWGCPDADSMVIGSFYGLDLNHWS